MENICLDYSFWKWTWLSITTKRWCILGAHNYNCYLIQKITDAEFTCIPGVIYNLRTKYTLFLYPWMQTVTKGVPATFSCTNHSCRVPILNQESNSLRFLNFRYTEQFTCFRISWYHSLTEGHFNTSHLEWQFQSEACSATLPMSCY